ncbi:MAG: sulfotransferase [Pseudomonadota bacterium]
MAAQSATVPDRETLLTEARGQAHLDDFGDPWFFPHIDHLVGTLNSEARLNLEGAFGARTTIVNSLVNKLRHIDLVKKHPEIRKEDVQVAAIVVGLPRTGSTMLHRMLSAAPGMTGVKWFEAHHYVPLPEEGRGETHQRREAASALMAYMLDKIPELMSIHPMSIDQPDEEVIILGQLFSSTMLEASYYIPSYARWLAQQNPLHAYRDLKEILQSLQWQDPARKGARWVLKTPGHLMALDAVRAVFPEAKIVMTHRDPKSTVPSYCSMEQTLYRLGSDEINAELVAGYWPERLKDLLKQFMDARENVPPGVFIDVAYADLISDPIVQASRVLKGVGVEDIDLMMGGMSEWIEANKREDRAAHRYSLGEYGLTADAVDEMFAGYNAAYLSK